MMKKLERLFEKYNFDYIFIGPNDIDSLEWEYIPEELLIDFITLPGYLGTIKFNDKDIKVFYDEKITSGDVIFKYKSIKKERKIKLSILGRESE